MATLYSKGTGGNWSTLGTFNTLANGTGTDTIPTGGSGGDDVIIQEDDIVTLDTTGLVCKSLTLNNRSTGTIGGKLTCTTSANWDLTVYNTIVANGNAGGATVGAYSSVFELDMSSAGAAGYTGTIYLNGSNTTSGTPLSISGRVLIKGTQKTRSTITTDPLVRNTTTSVHVADATGWRSGDKIVFASTQGYDATSRGGTTINSVTWSGGYLTVGVSTAHNLVAGEWVMFTNLQTTLNNIPFQVYDAATTTFRVAMADPTVTDTAGTLTYLPRVDVVTLSSSPTFDSGSSGPATISWTDGWGTGGAVVENHDDNCLCGNLTSNLVFRPVTAYANSNVQISTSANNPTATEISDVLFYQTGPSTGFSNAGSFTTNGLCSNITLNRLVFDSFSGAAINANTSSGLILLNDFQFYSMRSGSLGVQFSSPNGSFGTMTDFCAYLLNGASTGVAFTATPTGTKYIRPKFSGIMQAAFSLVATDGTSRVEGGGVWGCRAVGSTTTSACPPIVFDSVWIGEGFEGSTYSSANNLYIMGNTTGSPNAIYLSCPENLSGGSRFEGIAGAFTAESAFYNRDDDPANQDVYMTRYSVTSPVFSRDTSSTNYKNAISSVKVATLGTTTDAQTREFPLLVRGGEAATILLYVKKNTTYNDGTYTLPSATLSGLGITPITASGTDVDDTWELLDLSYGAANAPILDGELTLTLSASSNTPTGVVYFSGIPMTPYVTRCRHYGYLVDETNPVRVADTAIDPAISATTAAGYGGAGVGPVITWGTTVSTIATDADTTFKKLVHYTSAKMVDNVASVMPITWAGVYDAPAIFAQGNINISGDTLDGSGSLAMTGETATTGAMTLSADATADKFTRASGDFTTDGFAVGSVVTTSGFANAANNGTFTITALTATEMTVDAALTTETGSGNEEIVENTLLTATTPFSFTYGGGTYSRATGGDPAFSGGSLNIGAAAAGLTFTGASLIISMTPTAPGTYEMGAGTFSGTIDLRNTSGTHAITVELPAGTSYITSNNRGATITVSTPSVERGLEFTGLVAGSFVKVFNTGATTELFSTLSSSTTETWDDATSGSLTVDYVIMKAGYLPIRVTGVTVTGAVGTGIQTVPISQTVDRSYVASSGLTWAEIALDTTNKYVKLNDTSTVQNLYSFMIEQWIDRGGVGATGAELANVKFPVTSNGPSGFSLIDGWETRGFTTAGTGIANTTLTNLTRDGLRYVDTGGTQTAVWSAILTSGVPSGARVRYQQSDAGTTVDALVSSGNMDELVHVYGDASHGNFDKRGYLVLKVQEMGYDQAVSDVVALYGNLEDQLYVVGLAPTPNGVATGDPSLATAPTITQGTYTLDGQTYSVKIVDGATANSGTDIMRWLRYNFETGGTFQSEDAFNWHDLVQTNGSSFKTVRGTVYGTATTKGVVVYQNDGTTLHPDFTLFTADNGTTYTPPATHTINLSGFASGTRIQIYDTLNSTQLFLGVVSATTKVYTETRTVDRNIRIRAALLGKMFVDMNIGSLTASNLTLTRDLEQVDNDVYNTNGVDGSTITGMTIDDAGLQFEFSSGTIVTYGTTDVLRINVKDIYAYEEYWLTTDAGIIDDGKYITAIDTANYQVFNTKFLNATVAPAYPINIIGGYVVDGDTGVFASAVDYSGTESINNAPDHVAPIIVNTTGTPVVTGDITEIPGYVQSGLTAQGLTTTRAGKLDNLDKVQTILNEVI